MSVFVISAPSGAGKTTLNRRLVSEFPELEVCISHTTRPIRPGEEDGSHYHFVERDAFMSMVDQGLFLEWAEVHGKLYGTSKTELNRIIDAGRKPILEIDVQGWETARPLIKDATSIFILPPSLEALWLRLESRGSDSLETRWTRLCNAIDEIKHAEHYQYFLVNQDIETAYAELKDMVIRGNFNDKAVEKGKNLCEKLNDEYENADWINGLRKELKLNH